MPGSSKHVFCKILELSGLKNGKDFLMVGDSDVDSTFARKLGIKCIIVKF